MDQLERIIKENKDAFDQPFEHQDRVWSGIERELPPRILRIGTERILGIAASFLVIISASLYLLYQVNENAISPEQEYVSQELIELDFYYNKLISVQVKELEGSEALSEEDKLDFLSFLNELDDEYLELKIELEEEMDNQRVLEAIIENYRTRLQLLENFNNRIK